jgi:tetratricopeptide (TPR) repeat protein
MVERGLSEARVHNGTARCERLPPGGSAAGLAAAALAVLLPAFAVTPAAAAGKCTLGRLPVMTVTMEGLRPMVHARINGTDALFIADSGAFFSFVTPTTVRELHMRLDPELALNVHGVSGAESAQVAWAKTFTIIGQTIPTVPFVVLGEFGGAAGLLGQNVFRIADVEYDLANGVIRLVQPRDCGKDTPLAYWASDAHKPYSVIDIEFANAEQPHTRSVAWLNGKKIHVIFDTGAPRSVLTLAAAHRAGIAPTSEGVIAGGASAGIGHGVSTTWIARFASFKIGDEEVDHARLRFGNIDLPSADMLIGTDFFLSHRIYVASSQGKLYFTYNGGPVFDLTPTSAVESAGASAVSGAAAATPADVASRLNQPSDAAGFARRGAASAARQDYAGAVADLTRACELAPTEASYFYERGMAYWGNKQGDLALVDFDKAIGLRPDDVDALIARATLHASHREPAEVVAADLEAADRALPKEAEAHMRIGDAYAEAGQPGAAVVQYSKWIDSHLHDERRTPTALNSRCWARALLGQELHQALADCTAALRARPASAEILDSRGLVYFRQGNYDKAIADYDAALRLQPKSAWSLYGRGLAKLRKGMSAQGQADIAAATALEPKIAERAGRYGITQ